MVWEITVSTPSGEYMHLGRTSSESTSTGRKYRLVPVSRFDSVFGALPTSHSCPPGYAYMGINLISIHSLRRLAGQVLLFRVNVATVYTHAQG